jgi:hypothetical protein
VIITGPVATRQLSAPTATVSQVSVPTGAPVTLLAANSKRQRALIVAGAKDVWVKFGSGAASTSYTWLIPFKTGWIVEGYTGLITALASGGVSIVAVTEL